jgi:hypothetical protein
MTLGPGIHSVTHHNIFNMDLPAILHAEGWLSEFLFDLKQEE